jgi:hypothetical protein
MTFRMRRDNTKKRNSVALSAKRDEIRSPRVGACQASGVRVDCSGGLDLQPSFVPASLVLDVGPATKQALTDAGVVVEVAAPAVVALRALAVPRQVVDNTRPCLPPSAPTIQCAEKTRTVAVVEAVVDVLAAEVVVHVGLAAAQAPVVRLARRQGQATLVGKGAAKRVSTV